MHFDIEPSSSLSAAVLTRKQLVQHLTAVSIYSKPMAQQRQVIHKQMQLTAVAAMQLRHRLGCMGSLAMHMPFLSNCRLAGAV